MRSSKLLLVLLLPILSSCFTNSPHVDQLTAVWNEADGTVTISRAGDVLVTQNAPLDHRPFLHPVTPADGQGSYTQYSPDHHKHQTGVYWAYTNINGRDYFHNPSDGYWKRVIARVGQAQDSVVTWSVSYDLLAEDGSPVLRETQNWSAKMRGDEIVTDVEWRGMAHVDVSVAAHDYGGLFVRMPWEEGADGYAINTARQRNQSAEQKRAMWMDVGMKVEGRDDYAHVAIFDHPDNDGFPQNWRVDDQLGIGPSRSIQGDWSIKKGETEVIKHRLVFYTGPFQEFRERWDGYIGTDNMYSIAELWMMAREEGEQAEFLDPQQAVDAMTIKEGFKVSAFAAEPLITQPMAFAWDDKGRMWIAENRDYETRQKGFSNDGNSRILILEDTDGDGQADSKKVFLEGIPFPSAIALGFDGLYLGAPPHFMFVPDRNHDDLADENIEILLTGWGIRDRHETINSLHWGPDGWLYGLEGFATPSMIRKPDENDRIFKKGDPFPSDLMTRDGTMMDGGVWRYHPTKDIFEVVAHGFSNPWGIDYDSKGQMFISACVIPHLFHIIPGGVYQRQGGRHINPYVYDDIDTIVDHRHRSAHGGARVYQSDAFPPEHQGRLFMANIHEHAVLSDNLTRQGSGFVASHGEDFMLANNAAWIGFSMEVGPAGDMYVLDWHDGDICGNDVHDKDTGRVFRISPEESLAENWEGRYADLNAMSDLQLVNLQTSKSDWHARRARVILQNRVTKGEISPEAIDKMVDIFTNDNNADYRLRALWTIHVAHDGASGIEERSLADQDEYIRAWAVQLLSEDRNPSETQLASFQSMAVNDASSIVRMYLAAALQRLELDQRWTIAEALVAHEADQNDHNIPKLLWLGVEPLVELDPSRALALADNSSIPLVNTFLARRAMDADKIDQLLSAVSLSQNSKAHLLEGMLAGLEGRTDMTAPESWSEIRSNFSKGSAEDGLAESISQHFGDADAAQRQLAIVKDKTQVIENRQAALRSLATRQRKELQPVLRSLLEEDDLRLDAIRAVASYDDSILGQALLKKYPELSKVEQRELGLTMASRSSYGWMFTQALKKGDILKADVPVYIARQLRRVVGNGFVEVWGPIDDLSDDLENSYRKYRLLLTPNRVEDASPERGRELFASTCGTCHMMFGEGGQVGPELTGSNRSNLDYILSNTLNPSGDVAENYKATVLTTQDGRTYLGNITNETERQISLRVIGQDDIQINKSDIQTQETTEKSLMPEGLLQSLPDQDVADLISYLRYANVALGAN